MSKIKVLIVDDSNIIQKILISILTLDQNIEIIGTASDPYEAREKIKLLNPDVVTLDIEMPKMNGLEFLEKIMTLRPMPVVMISSLTEKGAIQTIKALELGAIDYISKPTVNVIEEFNNLSKEIIDKVKNAAFAKVKALFLKQKSILNLNDNPIFKNKLIAIGSSTGGVEAIKEVICNLPSNFPPIIIVQHMPSGYTKSLANRLDGLSKMRVCEAQDKQEIITGNIYIAPGGIQTEIIRKNNKLFISLNETMDLVSGHRPSVDVLFNSVASNVGAQAIGVILTGMGKDGSLGMLKMKEAGSFNIGQNEETCVVYGMPKAAKQNNAVNIELSLDKIAINLIKYCQ